VRRVHVTGRARIVSMSMGLGFALSLPACGGPATSADEEEGIATQSSEIKGGVVTPAKGSVKVDVYWPAPVSQWSTCSGTVGSRRTVITAAHCVTYPLGTATSGNVLVHISRENASKTFDEVLPAATVLAQYNPAYNGSSKNDVAVITSPANLQNVVQSDVVPMGKDTPNGGNWWALGYGYSDFTTTDGQGRLAQVLVSLSGTEYVFYVSPTGPWLCSGDSGGALKQQTATATTLYGIYSQGSGPSNGKCSSISHWATTGLNMTWLKSAIGSGNCTETSTTVSCW
jgi:hypothetical protein